MKPLHSAAVGIFLLTSVAAHAQTSDDTVTKVAPPTILQDKEPVSEGEKKKKEYKSKEWRQGMERVADTAGAAQKPKPPMRKKAIKKPLPPPPPPPPGLPPAPPKPSEK